MHRNNLFKVSALLFFGIGLVIFSVIAIHLQIIANDTQLLKPENSSSLRSRKSKHILPSNSQDLSNEDTKYDVDAALEKAKNFISEASASELEDSIDTLHEEILKIKETLKRTLEGIIKYYDNVSDSDREDIKDEVYKQLEKDMVKKIKDKVESHMQLNTLNLDSMVNSGLNGETSNEDIKKDIKHKSTFLLDNVSSQIENLEKELEQSIHKRAQQIEKNVIFDKIGVKVSDHQHEESDIETHVSDTEKKVMGNAAKSETRMYQEVSSLASNVAEIVNNVPKTK